MKILIPIFLLMFFGCAPVKEGDEVPGDDRTSLSAAAAKTDKIPETDIFTDEFALDTRFNQKITFSFKNKNILEILRTINTLSGLDLGVDPGVLKHNKDRRFTLTANDLPLRIFLDWSARLMDCYYVRSSAPDIWFVNEQTWLKDVPVRWKGYPSELAMLDMGETTVLSIVEEFQKGLSWIREDIQPVFDGRRRLIMVNSTDQGHRRLKKAIRIFTDQNLLPLHRIKDPGPDVNAELMMKKVSTPLKGEDVRDVIRRISMQTGMNVGYNPLNLKEGKPLMVHLPLSEYPLNDMLNKIVQYTPFSGYHWEGDNAVWFYLENDPVFFRNRYIRWASMNVYIIQIRSISKEMRGRDILRGIKKNVYSDLWNDPCSLLSYNEKLDILIVIQRTEVMKEIVRYLKSIEKFGKIQTNRE